jgi:hypothetical protein
MPPRPCNMQQFGPYSYLDYIDKDKMSVLEELADGKTSLSNTLFKLKTYFMSRNFCFLFLNIKFQYKIIILIGNSTLCSLPLVIPTKNKFKGKL